MEKEGLPEKKRNWEEKSPPFGIIVSNTSEQIERSIHSPWVKEFIVMLLRKLGIKSKEKLERLVEKTGVWGTLTIQRDEIPKIWYEIGYWLPQMSVRNLRSFRLFCEIHGFLPIPTWVKIQVAPNRWMEFNLEDNNILSNTIKSLAVLSDKEADYRIAARGKSVLKKLEEENFISRGFYALAEFIDVLKEIHRLVSFWYNVYAPLMGSGLAQEGRFSTDLMAEKIWLDMAFVLEDEIRAIFEWELGSTFLFPASVIEDFQQKTDMRGLISFDDDTSWEFPIQFSASRLRKDRMGIWVDKLSDIKKRVKKYPSGFLIINVNQMTTQLEKWRKNGSTLRTKYNDWRNNPFVRNSSFWEAGSNWSFPAFWYIIEKENPELAEKMKVMYLFYHLLLIFLKTNASPTKGKFNKFKRKFARKIKDILGITIWDYQIEITTTQENKWNFKVRIIDLVIKDSSDSFIGAISWLEPIFEEWVTN